MVDVFEVEADAGMLSHVKGVKIIPEGSSPECPALRDPSLTALPADHSASLYWADEVRVSPSQKYLYCSTRGLEPQTKGWVAVYGLTPEGLPASDAPLCLWETPTSGGWANAVEPSPGAYNKEDCEYVALTDSEEGLVMILGWDGKAIREVARTKLEGGAGAATAIWL